MKLPVSKLTALFLLSALTACGGGGGGDDDLPVPAAPVNSGAQNITFYDETTDSRIASFERDGKQLTIFGTKNADGTAETIDSLYMVEGDKAYSISLDEHGLPFKSLDHSDGSTATFEYSMAPGVRASSGVAAAVAINAINLHLTRFKPNGSESVMQATLIAPVEIPVMAAPKQVVDGNVEINVYNCGNPIPKDTDVKVRYFSGRHDTLYNARYSGIPGKFFATIPEKTDLRDPNNLIETTAPSQWCSALDKVASIPCGSPVLLATSATAICAALAAETFGVSLAACAKAWVAYRLYCATTAPGTPPGSMFGEYACGATASIEDYVSPRRMNVQANVFEYGSSPITSAVVQTDYYGKHDVYLSVDISEPAFESFVFTPKYPEITGGYTIDANYHCVQGRSLDLQKVGSDGWVIRKQRYAQQDDDSIGLDIPGREFSDNTDSYDSDTITSTLTINRQGGVVELINSTLMLWRKPDTVDPTPPPAPGNHAGIMSGTLGSTCSDGYSDDSRFSVAVDANGIVTGSYDWGNLTGVVTGDFMSVELDGDWSDCVFGGDLSGSGNNLSGSGIVSCTGSSGICNGTWSGS